MPKLTARIIASLIALALVVGLLLLGPAACQKIRSLTAQSKVDQGQSTAFHNSTRDAIEVEGNVTANQSASEDLTRRNTEEIRNAEGAADRVNPAVRDAGFAGLCRRAAYRDTERCRLLRAPAK